MYFWGKTKKQFMALPIYLDYAATTPLAPEVLNEMLPYFIENFGNAGSRHHAYGWLAEEAVDESKERIAKAFLCKKNEIIFTSGATESINLALKGFLELNPNYQIISCATEHKATLEVVADVAKRSIKTTFLEVNKEGEISLEELETELQKGKSLVSIIWVNNETGLIHPISEIIKLKEKYDFVLHVDATQALGKIKMDFSNIDFLSFSAHKIYGPKGMGGLLINDSQKINSQILGGGQQRNMRSGTLNIPGIVGMGKALELANNRIVAFNAHCQKLKSRLESEILKNHPKTKINASNSRRVSNISNICFDGFDGEDLMRKLHKVAISNGSACNSATTFPSHVLTAMGMSEADAFASLRFSFGWGNSEKDLEVIFENLANVVR
jgi:cysteine desulfurase